MTSSSQRLVSPSAPAGAAAPNGHRAAPGAGLPTRNHPKGYVALAVALIVTFAALGYWFYTQAGSKVAIVKAAADIPVGHTIERSDLTTVEVAGGITAVAGNHLDSLVGQVAVVEILPGTPIQRAMVGSAAPLPASKAIVGVALAAGQLPSSGLRPGDHVQVIGLAPKGAASGSTSSSVLADSVLVSDVRDNPSASGGVLVSLVVPVAATVPIATASNSGLVALVRVGS